MLVPRATTECNAFLLLPLSRKSWLVDNVLHVSRFCIP
jgi:hypothetical protein